ncbi:hypothetical protein BC628DRAFT_1489006 [Trametes gibbosa]|nr:hypothetical protein BC628DRAFT_1489006 [Trametes gibbosa]
MPRRSRPANRRPPSHAAAIVQQTKSLPTTSRPPSGSNSGTKSRSRVEDYVSDSSESGSELLSEDDSAQVSERSDFVLEAPEELDADAEPDIPRAVQWVDEEELEALGDEQTSSDSSEDEEGIEGDLLEADLKALPFGALRKAQKTLAKAQVLSDSEDDELSEESQLEEMPSSLRPAGADKGKEREKKEVPKRKNKHAPMEMSSKRPVSRSRFIAEENVVPRDPRFLPVSGEFDPRRFHTQYGFLSDMHKEEMKTLRENLKRARKLLINSPHDLREEREAEVQRLERAVKRAESTVNRDRQEKVQLEALGKAKKEEREKRQDGKKAWFMKDADKKEFLLKAKYDALAASGGRSAVRKAIEKKQKKVGQKEKKKRPFVSGPPPRIAVDAGLSRKRSRQGGEGGRRKRTRTS